MTEPTNDTRMMLSCRMAYVHLDRPHKAAENGEAKYSVTALIPKDDPQLAFIKKATAAAKATKWPSKVPTGLRSCVRDGDEKDEEGNYIRKGDEFRGHYYIAASSLKPVPVIVGKTRRAATSEDMQSGYYAVLNVNFAGYDAAGNKGVAAFLNAVWITKKGEILGGGDPLAAYENLEVEAEDFATTASGFAGDPFAAAASKKQPATVSQDEF